MSGATGVMKSESSSASENVWWSATSGRVSAVERALRARCGGRKSPPPSRETHRPAGNAPGGRVPPRCRPAPLLGLTFNHALARPVRHSPVPAGDAKGGRRGKGAVGLDDVDEALQPTMPRRRHPSPRGEGSGQRWIRTIEGVSQRIYSPPRLTTSVSTLLVGAVLIRMWLRGARVSRGKFGGNQRPSHGARRGRISNAARTFAMLFAGQTPRQVMPG